MSGATHDLALQGAVVPLTRPRHGRWLGGVCLAVGRARHLKVAWVRAAFVVASALGGVGVVVYAACWLIVPSEGDRIEAAGARQRVATVAQACAACTGLAALGALGAAATVFGFGWVVAALAAAVLLGVLAWWPRLGPAWTLLPIAALTLPSLAVAGQGWRLAPQAGDAVVAPQVAPGHTFSGATYRSGLGTLLVDLRRTPLPASGTIPLRIEAGVRRTIVALPHDRCVHVDLTSRVTPFLGRLGALLSGRDDRPFSDVVAFGSFHSRPDARLVEAPAAPGPTLKIDFTSMGGSLYVRDYPAGVAPRSFPNWPGFEVTPESRPDTTGMTRAGAAAVLRSWRARLREQLASKRAVDALIHGPCVPPKAPEATR